MSTISEHLAALEMYAANEAWDLFHSEQYLFVQVHFKEMIGERDASEMQHAREDMEKRLREQNGAKAEAFIEKWAAAQSASGDTK
jgi:hypothetical protein